MQGEGSAGISSHIKHIALGSPVDYPVPGLALMGGTPAFAPALLVRPFIIIIVIITIIPQAHCYYYAVSLSVKTRHREKESITHSVTRSACARMCVVMYGRSLMR